MMENHIDLLLRNEKNSLILPDGLPRIEHHSKYQSRKSPEVLPLLCVHQTSWQKGFAYLLLVLAILFYSLHAHADACQGIHITGNISGKDAKLIVIDNSLISDDFRSKMPNGSTFAIKKGNIRKATVDSATTCSVAANSAGEITALKFTGATLKDVLIEGATVELDGKTTLSLVDNIRGLLTGVDVDIALVDIVISPDQQNDPLGLAKTTEIVTLTTIPTTTKEIPADLSLHYSASENGIYSLFTTSHPSQCWPLLCWTEGAKKTDNEFGGKTFIIPTRELKNKILLRNWTTGVLVVPYKYALASHSLAQGSLTIGPYAGYTTDVLGMQLTFPFAAGITKVTVPIIQNGAASTSEKFGISIATGLLFRPGGNAGAINTGVLLGVDQLGPNSGYADNGKLWLGIYVGAGF